MYSIKEMATISGVTIRTLRYYDKIGLLVPSNGRQENNYRVYLEKDLDKLQIILFYKELNFKLDDIKSIINSDDFNVSRALEKQVVHLEEKIKRLSNVHMLAKITLKNILGGIEMKQEEKFEAFKEKQIKENHDKYGNEVISMYGEDVYKESIKKYKNLTKEQHQDLENLLKSVNESFVKAKLTNNPSSVESKEAVILHRKWITYFWPSYNKEAYLGLAETYIADDRFAAYYNKLGDNMAQFVRDCIVDLVNSEE